MRPATRQLVASVERDITRLRALGWTPTDFAAEIARELGVVPAKCGECSAVAPKGRRCDACGMPLCGVCGSEPRPTVTACMACRDGEFGR